MINLKLALNSFVALLRAKFDAGQSDLDGSDVFAFVLLRCQACMDLRSHVSGSVAPI